MRVRKRIHGTAARPRLSVFRSAAHIYAQLVDDDRGLTLAAVSTRSAAFKEKAAGTAKKTGNKEAAGIVGTLIAEMANIGTLSAFLVAAIGVLVLRITKPDVPRTFRCPLVWLIAPLAVLTCGYLMYHLPWETWVRFIVWCTFGCLVYFGYSYQHSALAHPHDDEE